MKDNKVCYGENVKGKEYFLRLINTQHEALQFVLDSFNDIEGLDNCKTIKELDLLIRDRDLIRKGLSKKLAEKLGVNIEAANNMLVLPSGYASYMDSITHYKKQKINPSYIFNFDLKGLKVVQVQKSLDAVLDTHNYYSAEVDKVKGLKQLETLVNTTLKEFIDSIYGRIDFPYLQKIAVDGKYCYRIKPSLQP